MTEILIFNKDKSKSDGGELGWAAVCKAAHRDFNSTGFGYLAEDFLKEFRPYYDELMCDMRVPMISADTEQHRVWKEQLDELILTIKNHTGRLVRDRYLRELSIFCERHIT